jgi:hypothetical protein
MVDDVWLNEFRQRMHAFSGKYGDDGVGVSIKVRVRGGCFHREHSPRAYEELDEFLRKNRPQDGHFAIEEHESGPEVLAYIILAGGAANLTAAVINVVTAILKARSDGIKKGDSPRDSLHVIVRLVDDTDFREREALKVEHDEKIDKKVLENSLRHALLEVTDEIAKKNKKTPSKKKKK